MISRHFSVINNESFFLRFVINRPMQPIEIPKRSIPNEPTRALSFFPKAHVFLAGGLISVLIAATALPSNNSEARRHTLSVDLPKFEHSHHSSPAEISWPDLDLDLDLNTTALKETELTVKSGDTLSTLFQKAGFSDRDMYSLVNSGREAKKLAKLYPGRKLIFSVNDDGKLHSLVHHIDALNSEVFTATEAGGYDYTKIEKKPDIKQAVRTGVINSSLYKAGLDAGLDEDLIMSLAGIFGWDVDFALDIRKGDSFRILYEEKFLDGKRLGSGAILAAEFTNQGNTLQAVRYVDRDGETQYYSPTGKAMRKAFLRAPLDFRRISSNFNPRRLHPITKTVRPHRGIDYAANRGTPVWAAGDGKIISSGYTEANGNYVVIQHGSDVQTKYLHLHTRAVKAGTRVRQGQVIGTVGSTGYSTAPHLHYEFLLDGVHRDPRTILQKLPKAVSIESGELQRFYAQTQPLMAQLDQTTTLASHSPHSTKL
jgi:murein DD-endopeptidase MepM/ murein hydrolase activator NlpD